MGNKMKKRVLLTLFISIFFTSLAQKRKVSLLFAGDAMQHTPQITAAKSNDGFNYDTCFYLIKERLLAADLAFVNFETTLAGKPYTGYPTFSAPDEFALALKNTGFDVFFLANNHTVDKGKKGLERTIDVLDVMGIKHTGTFKNAMERDLYYPLIIIKNGIRIALLNYTYGTNGLPVHTPNIVNLIDTVEIKKDLKWTSLYKPDIVVANLHWGNEYVTSPHRQQIELAQWLTKNGVRIVIGHHPHVVQPLSIELESDKIQHVIFYSLGNFISNQRKINTDGGAIAEIVISKDEDSSNITIESCNYWLVWVDKYYANGKNNYRLIPSWLNSYENIRDFGSENRNRMDIFVKNATKIIERKL